MSEMQASLMGADQGLNVEIEGERLVISIGTHALCDAIRQGPYFERLIVDEQTGRFEEERLIFTDRAKFAEEVLRSLKDENESGETQVHRLLDAAAEHAFEQGAQGIALMPPVVHRTRPDDSPDDNPAKA